MSSINRESLTSLDSMTFPEVKPPLLMTYIMPDLSYDRLMTGLGSITKWLSPKYILYLSLKRFRLSAKEINKLFLERTSFISTEVAKLHQLDVLRKCTVHIIVPYRYSLYAVVNKRTVLYYMLPT
jgi:hypothetical protein